MSTELTVEVVKQLNNLAAFPRKGEFKLGDWFTGCQLCPAVTTFAALPLVGNTSGDIRFVTDIGQFYYWHAADAHWDTASGRDLKVKTVDEQVASSTVVQNDDQLYVVLISGKKYRIRASLFFSIPADGLRVSLNGPGVTATSLKVQFLVYDSTIRASERISALGQEATHTAAGAGDHYVVLDGSIEVATGGTLYLQWAQQSSNATPLVLQKDSFFEVERITG